MVPPASDGAPGFTPDEDADPELPPAGARSAAAGARLPPELHAASAESETMSASQAISVERAFMWPSLCGRQYTLLFEDIVLAAHDHRRLEVWQREPDGWTLEVVHGDRVAELRGIGCRLSLEEVYGNPLE